MNPKNFAEIKTNVLSGLTVALVPEAIAFALVAHVHPLVGLYAAFMVSLITSLIRGTPRDDFRCDRRAGGDELAPDAYDIRVRPGERVGCGCLIALARVQGQALRNIAV